MRLLVLLTIGHVKLRNRFLHFAASVRSLSPLCVDNNICPLLQSTLAMVLPRTSFIIFRPESKVVVCKIIVAQCSELCECCT